MDPEQILIGILDRGISDLADGLERLGQTVYQLINSYNRLDEEMTALEQGLDEIKALALTIRSN